MIPIILAPLLAKLAESGLNLIGNAVLNKGKDYVEGKLGVSLDDATKTEAGMLNLQQLQNDHEEMLILAAVEDRKVDLDFYKVDAADRDSARTMATAIQESLNSSWLAKNFSYLLDSMIIGGTMLLTGALFFKTIPDDNLQIANIALGTLLTLCATVVNFHRGSSSSSVKKDSTISNLAATGATK